MKKNLYLIGAGDFGREMESWLELLPEFNEKWEVMGFLDNKNTEILNEFPSDYSIIGAPENYNFAPNDYVLLCVTNPIAKKRISLNLVGKVKFFTYIAPNAILAKFVKIGEGSIICPNVVISTNVVLDDFVTINLGTQIGHDCKIGKFSSIMANVDLGGCVTIGENIFMGTNSTIIPRLKINNDIVIGTGAIVTRNLKKSGTYFGNPATLINF
jgi:sugar O-acyltransferase (sialic acid O-acetyltransferase NeuD family)